MDWIVFMIKIKKCILSIYIWPKYSVDISVWCIKLPELSNSLIAPGKKPFPRIFPKSDEGSSVSDHFWKILTLTIRHVFAHFSVLFVSYSEVRKQPGFLTTKFLFTTNCNTYDLLCSRTTLPTNMFYSSTNPTIAHIKENFVSVSL